MRMELTSPLNTVLNHMLQSSPITTSPIIVALSAKKQLFPNAGVNPRTDLISAIMICFLIRPQYSYYFRLWQIITGWI